MDNLPPLSTQTDPDGTDWHRPLLRELAELAMDAARRAHARLAVDPAPSEPAPDSADAAQAGLLFTRLARTVRQTIALDARLAAADHAATTSRTDEQARRARTESRRRDHRRADLRRRLTQTIRDSADPSDTESLLADLDDRLDDDDIHAMLDHVPVIRIVADLCAEWGITPNLADWTDEELEIAADPGPAARPTPVAHGPPPC